MSSHPQTNQQSKKLNAAEVCSLTAQKTWIRCESGQVWLSHDGQDVILECGQKWFIHSKEKVVLEALQNSRFNLSKEMNTAQANHQHYLLRPPVAAI